jgi:hypothetical protein
MEVGMTLKEELHIGMQAIEMEKQGKPEEATRLMRSIPMEPWLAAWYKKRMGVEALIKGGWNLSAAEAAFGKDWLSR